MCIRDSISIGVHHDLCPAAEGGIRDRVHVSDDEVRAVPCLEQRIGAAVDADQDRSELADIVPQRLQVVFVMIAANHHKSMTTVKDRLDVRNPYAIEQERSLAPQVLHRVGRKRLELDGKPGPRLDHRGRDDVLVEEDPLGYNDLTDVQGVAIKASGLPVLQGQHVATPVSYTHLTLPTIL